MKKFFKENKKKLLILAILLIGAGTYIGVKNNQPLIFNVENYGAKGDGKIIHDGAITATLNVLTSATAGFTSADVGKSVRVQGAGAANVDLVTTISGFTNSTTVTLTANASSTKSGTTVDYGTDNTVPIQTVLQVATDAGGGKIYAPRGIYMLFGALQTSVNSVNPNCQIYIPLTNVTSKSVCQLEIVGEYAMQVLPPILVTTFANLVQSSTVFKSEIDGSGTLPAVFGSPYYVPAGLSGANENLTSVKFRNIFLQNKSQVNNVETASTMSGMNMLVLNQFSIENSVIGTESILLSAATQVSSTTYGIIFPEFLNNGLSKADDVMFTGYHWGALISDHFDAGRIVCVMDYYALKYENGVPGNANLRGHDAVIKHLQTEQTTRGINVTGESGIHILSWSGERDASGNWYATSGNDVDFTGSGVSGYVDVDHIDMTLNGVPDNVITTNNTVRAKFDVINGNTWPFVDKIFWPSTNSGVPAIYNANFANTAFSDLIIYPQNAATNVASRIFISPKGTGSAGDVTDILLANKDFPADQTNVEFFKLQTTGTQYNMFSVAAGTGTVRPIVIYTGANTSQATWNIDGTVSFGSSIKPVSVLATGAQSNSHVNISATGTYNATATDYTIEFTGSTATLVYPTLNLVNGRELDLVNYASGSITIPSTKSGNAATITTLTTNQRAIVEYDLSNTTWIVKSIN